ncbi:MAG: dienelactone hydrolase family protein [Armatimonadetes bacterium]|nr:dienelactone hydrolase family protein [Armatimonadota bacterium]
MKALSWMLLLLPAAVAAQTTVDPVAASEAREFRAEGGGKLLYRLLKPADYDPAKAYPLVLWLHGAGGRGDNNSGQMTDQIEGLRQLANEPQRTKYPCFVLAPQCPGPKRWVDVDWNHGSYSQEKVAITPELTMVLGALTAVEKEFKVDATRRYVVGLSMGGYGTWDLLGRQPEMWAAGIPVCGSGDPSRAAAMAKIPVWAFHGDKDGVVPPQGSRDMIAALKAAGGDPKYTECAGVGHDAWNPTFRTAGLWDWLLAQHR